MNKGLTVAALVALICLLLPVASAETTERVHPYADLAFTDVSDIQDAVEWRDGYAAATHGGLVLWPGEGPRQVLTSTDGLPSNVVWELAWTSDEELLVATERGVVVVDPFDGSVEPLDVPADVEPAVADKIHDIHASEEGDWWILDRGGNLSHRSPEGSWSLLPTVPKHRANELYIDTDRVLAIGEEPNFGPEGYQNWSVYELADDQWEPLHHTEKAPVEVAVFQGYDVVGMREAGIQAFENGERVDLGAPEALSTRTVRDLVPDGERLWVATTDGLFVYRSSADAWDRYGREDLPGTWVNTVVPDPAADEPGVGMLATSEGLGLRGEETDWVLHRGINGPEENFLLSLASREGDRVWAGSSEGVNIFFPSVRLWNHWDQSELGTNVDSSRIHDIEHRGNYTWFGTNYGVYQFDRSDDSWRIFLEQDPPKPPANTFYDVTPEGDWLWMAEWGSGLLQHRIGTNQTYKYQMQEGLISNGVTCVDRWHEFVAVCSNEAFQLFNLSRTSPANPLGVPYSRCNTHACNYTAPMNTTFAALPDGERIWVASAHAGLVSLTRDDDVGIAVEHQWTTEDGLPADEVRAIEPAADGVWVGTTGGLARVNVDGVQETWTDEDGFGQPGINDVERLGDVLHIATLEGLYRLDLDDGSLLPMFEGSGSLSDAPGHVSVTFPGPGARLSAATNMTGTASAPGQAIEEVQVRIDEGEWDTARGTKDWRYRLPVPELDTGSHLAEVRVLANGSDVANASLSFAVVERSPEDSNIAITHEPPRRVFTERTHFLTVTVDAPEPWTVEMDGTLGDERLEVNGRRAGNEVTFPITVPEDAAGSELRYRFLVKSGAGEAWFPAEGRYNASVQRQHDRGLDMELERDSIRLSPGETAEVPAVAYNTGDLLENVTAEVWGLHASWASASPSGTIPVPPGESLDLSATVTVPEEAEAGATTFTLTAGTEDSLHTVTDAFTVHVVEPEAQTSGGSDPAPTPAPTAVLAGLLTTLTALLTRSRRDRT